MTFFHSRRSKFWGPMWFKSKSESLLLLRDFHFCRLRPAKPPNTTRPQEKQPTSPAALKPAKEQTNKSPNDKHMASFYGGTSRTPPPPSSPTNPTPSPFDVVWLSPRRRPARSADDGALQKAGRRPLRSGLVFKSARHVVTRRLFSLRSHALCV